VAVVLFVVVEVVLTIFFIYSSFPLSIFFFQKSLLPVFGGSSAFKRTLCGGKWSLYFTSPTGPNGRYGCCDAGTYMAFPELNPFVKANACQNCPSPSSNPNENARLNCVPPCAVTNGSMVNGNDCVCGTGTCTASTGLFCKLNYCATGPFGSNALPNGDGSTSDPGTGLRKVVSDWISGGATKNTVLTTYGPIEDWNVSHVTSLAYLFYNMNTGNPDISKWNAGAVTDMGYSKFFID